MESIKRVVNAASQALGSDKSAEDSQRAVFSGTTGFPAADFVFIQLKQQTDMLIVRKAFSEFINRPTDGLEAVLGVSPSLWCLIDPEAPSMIDFKSIEFSNTPDKIAFQQSSWQVMLYVKGDRYDRLFDFSRAFIDSLAGQTDLVRTYQAFDYRGGRDMTGFFDGTRNPPIYSAIVDTAVLHASDYGERHVGGSMFYCGRFVHKLSEFESLTSEQKSAVMGRKWGEESRSWMGLENPQLDPLPNDCHIARGYGPFFRQAYPYRSSSAESGLMFLAFARRHEEINTALRRMAGHFDKEKRSDRLMDFTTNAESSFFYAPPRRLLLNLDSYSHVPVIDQKSVDQSPTETDNLISQPNE